MNVKVISRPDSWSLDGDTIKGPRADGYPPLFRVENPEASETALALAAPAMLAALKEQRVFLGSLHTTYRRDSRLAVRVAAHITAATAAIDNAEGR